LIPVVAFRPARSMPAQIAARPPEQMMMMTMKKEKGEKH
jgi:hypothetical protein